MSANEEATPAIQPIETCFYPLTDALEQRVQQALYDHEPNADQRNRDSIIRHAARELMRAILSNTPPSREQSLALTHLEDSCLWSFQAMVRNERGA